MLVIGLTGGIGSGKTTASRHFEKLGVPVIDADIVARQLVEPGTPTLKLIVETFGEKTLNTDGRLNREQMRDTIFSNPSARKKLEQLLHPPIRQHMHDWLASQTTPYAILVIPLLLETGQSNLIDRLLVVDIPANEQIRRVNQRDGLKSEQIQQILSAQISREERLAAADDVLTNDGTIDSLRQQVEKLHHLYLSKVENNR